MNYTLRHAVRRAYEKNINDVQGWAFRRYPGFILSDQVQRLQEIPVFVFHQVTRHWLEPLLQFLAANGYRTLTGDELYTRLMSGTLGHERQVVLTFDDGHKSLWTVAYPLLRQYGLKAIAFIVPALVPAQADGTAWGRAAEELCTWSELRTMQQAGVIDCQAHSLYHHTIYISPRIIGYISPSHQVLSLAGDLFPVLDEDNTRRLPSDLPLGTPLYASAPRLSGRRRYLDSPGLRRACADFVDHQGGARFFEAPQWRERLDQFVRRVWSSFRHETRFETQAERRAAIRLDLSRSQYLLEEKLAGQPVRHFCFPWYIGDRLPVEIAGELGYQTNFWGGLAPRFTQAYPRPLPIPRLDPLYIWRLPGQGRQSVRQILQQRVGQLTKMRGSP